MRKKVYRTYPNYRINVTLAKQIGNYAKLILPTKKEIPNNLQMTVSDVLSNIAIVGQNHKR